jgi:hypothetical protein
MKEKDNTLEVEHAKTHFLRRVSMLALFPFAGFTAVLLFAAVLISLRLEKSVGDLLEDRTALIAQQLNNVVEGGLRFGVPLPDQAAVPGKMRSLIANDEALLTVALFDETGKRLLAEDRDGKIPDLDTRIVQRVLAQQPSKSAERYTRTWRTDGEQHVVMQSRDALGGTGGVVWAIYSAKPAHEAFSRTLDRLTGAAAAMLAVSVLLIFGVVTLIWRKWEQHVNHAHSRFRDDALDAQLIDSPLPGVSLAHALQHIGVAEGELLAIERKMMEKSI